MITAPQTSASALLLLYIERPEPRGEHRVIPIQKEDDPESHRESYELLLLLQQSPHTIQLQHLARDGHRERTCQRTVKGREINRITSGVKAATAPAEQEQPKIKRMASPTIKPKKISFLSLRNSHKNAQSADGAGAGGASAGEPGPRPENYGGIFCFLRVFRMASMMTQTGC